MKKLLTRAIPLLLALLLFAAPVLAVPQGGAAQLSLLEEIRGILETEALYISGDLSLRRVTSARLEAEEGLFRQVVESWQADDKYGTFFAKEEYMSRYGSGPVLYGIGISVDMNMPLGVYVDGFLPGGGAERSGMEIGAQVVFVDGVNIADAVYMDARPLFLGAQRTTVEIGYLNPGSAEVFFEEIRRGALNVPSVQGHIMDVPGVGYISIERFGMLADSRLFDSYYNGTFPKEGAHSVIIDLRGNPGGQLDTVTAMLDLMLPDKGVLLCTQVDADGESSIYSTGRGNIWEPEQIVVLVDRTSASASEIFAGALQAHGLAVIVGETTHGKSHSQYHTSLSTGDVLVYTNSRIDLYAIGSYDEVGIIPDYIIEHGTITGAEADMRSLDTSRALFRQSMLTERITAMQERLAFLGYYRTEPSGTFDDYTLWCLNRFQAAHELPQGRFANVKTLRELDRAAMEAEAWEDAQLEFALELLINP
jgi:carboxyl-terminal processing protease